MADYGPAFAFPCGLQPFPEPAFGGGPPRGGNLVATLPPAQGASGGSLRPGVAVFRLLPDQDGAVEVAAVSAGLELSARLRLVLLDERGVVQAVSVARNWFGAYPEVAPLGLRPQGITTDPGVRLNFRGQAGQAYHLRVENYALAEDRVNLSATGFVPNPSGKGEALTSGSVQGAIEFVGEFDRYDVSGAGGYLRFVYAGPLDLVALLYNGPDDLYPRALDPVRNCAPSPRPPSSWSGTGASPGRGLTRRERPLHPGALLHALPLGGS